MNKSRPTRSTMRAICITRRWNFGDSILGLIVAEYLFKAYPGASEGELSRMKHRLVSEPTLAKASTECVWRFRAVWSRGREERRPAQACSVGRCLRSGNRSDSSGRRLEAAKNFVELALAKSARGDPIAAAAADPKTTLQEKTTGDSSAWTAVHRD